MSLRALLFSTYLVQINRRPCYVREVFDIFYRAVLYHSLRTCTRQADGRTAMHKLRNIVRRPHVR